MPSKLNRKYLTRKSPPDWTIPGVARMPRLSLALPPKVDLSPSGGPIKDQGQLGACTAFASTSMLEFLYRKYKAQQPVFSPLFQYYNERVMDGDFDQGDTGSTGRTAVQCLNKFGVCLETTEPYDDSGKVISQVPTQAQVTEALHYQGGAYHQITNVMDMKSCIASGYVFIIGFTVYDSFEADSTASSGLMPVPDPMKESVLGGHETLVIGYDDSITCPGASAGALLVQNSWGLAWGLKGKFWFPYQCAADPNVLMDAFIQHFGRPW
jgi:C1A family cysteine protease